MIFTERTVTISKGKATMEEPIILYRGDFEVELRFKIIQNDFKFKSGTNLVESEKATYAQLALLGPNGHNTFTDIDRCENGNAIFTLTSEMIDEISEVGMYSFQIRLFDFYQESRITIPPVEFGIEVREPVASEDHENTTNQSMVGYSIAKTAGINETIQETFDDDGQYNKTEWQTGDRISEGRLNKIEDAIHAINTNEITNREDLNRQMTSNYNVLLSMIQELAQIINKLTDNEE